MSGNAPDPESLMRSRYSAFVRKDAEYLLHTWHQDTRPAQLDLNENPAPQWLGLEIKRAPLPSGDKGKLTGVVEFVARYKAGGRAHRLHETSRFSCVSARWLYVDGDVH
ncbi:MAG: hypothetical protein RIR18_2333 [Pseudomonadota bacterium]|jgi:SEC-C motif-containing protein